MKFKYSCLNATTTLFAIAWIVVAGCSEPTHRTTAADGANRQRAEKRTKRYGDSTMKKLQLQLNGLLSEVKLPDTKEKEIRELHASWLRRMEDWYNTNGPTIVSIRSKALEAAKNKDLSSLRKLEEKGDKQKVADLVNAERKMLLAYQAEFEAAIPKAEKSRWQRYVIEEQLLRFLEPLKLSDDQRNQIRDYSQQALAMTKGKDNWSGYGTMELEKLFDRNVIAAHQQAEFDLHIKKNQTRLLKWTNRF